MRADVTFFPFFARLCHRNAIFSPFRASRPFPGHYTFFAAEFLPPRPPSLSVVFLHLAAVARRKYRAFCRLRPRGTVKYSAWFRHDVAAAPASCQRDMQRWPPRGGTFPASHARKTCCRIPLVRVPLWRSLVFAAFSTHFAG